MRCEKYGQAVPHHDEFGRRGVSSGPQNPNLVVPEYSGIWVLLQDPDIMVDETAWANALNNDSKMSDAAKIYWAKAFNRIALEDAIIPMPGQASEGVKFIVRQSTELRTA